MESKKVLENLYGPMVINMKEIGEITDLKEGELSLTMMEVLERDYLRTIITYKMEKYLSILFYLMMTQRNF